MTRWKRICGIYALISGVAMLILWGIVAASGFIAEDLAQPIYLTMLILAEVITSILLVVSGIGLLKQKPIGVALFPMAMGMLIYATLFGAGKFGQKGVPSMMFFLLIVSVVSMGMTGLFLKKTR